MVLVTQTYMQIQIHTRELRVQEINPSFYGQFIYYKAGENMQMEHKASSRKGHGKTGRQHLKNHVGFCCHSSSKSGKHFNPKPEVLSESESCSAVSDSLQPHGLYMPLDSPGPNTGVGSLSLLQGIFPTRESNPGLPYCRWILYQMSHKGTLKLLRISTCRRLHHIRVP